MQLSKSLKLGALAALGLLAASAAIALADSTSSRADYVAAVEPICKVNSDASTRILTGVHKLVRQGKLRQAGTKFAKASAALTKTQKQLAAVAPPAADAATINKWLGYIKTEASVLKKVSQALKAGNKNKASTYIVTLDHDTNLANNTVIAFGFHYCKGKQSSSYH